MTDTIETLADEYWAAYLADNPTEAHLLGDYPEQGRSRRPRAPRRTGTSRPCVTSPSGPRRSTRRRSTSSSRSPGGAGRRRDRAGRPAGGPADRARGRPDLRRAGLDAAILGHAGAARRGGRRGAGRQAPRARPLLPRARRAAARGRRRRADPRGVRGHATRSRSSTPILAAPVADDPLLRRRCAHPRASTSTPGGPPSRGDRADVRPAWRSTATCCATRCSRRPGPTSSAGCTGCRRRRGRVRPRRCATSRPPTKTAQEIHDIGLAQVAKLADEYRAPRPRGGRHRRPRARSSRRCAPTPSCTSSTATSWSRPPRSRWPRAVGGDGRLVRGGAAGAVRGAGRR